ncbi:odorant receptor 13a [Polyergus mexicanus]|uniref:odorant receptor 13a n=1 Tax=Polyergus mexicanus TaxID=615972 RepID=UPI0038B55641
MDFFDSRNYRVNKILLSVVGQWPYQSSKTSYIIVIVIATIACSQFLMKLCGMFSYIHDMDIVIECLTPIMIDILSITKVVNSILCVNEMRALLDQIRDDFRSLRNSRDIEILQKCADSGRKFSTIYIYTLYTLMVIFMLTPLPSLIFRTANETARPLLHIVEYYVDMDKYYFPILIHGYLTVAICVTSIVATDAIFVIFVQHVCGLFIVTGSRIERALQEKYFTDANLPITEDKAYRNMIQCVHDHRAAIRFIDLMEAAYSKHFLFYAGFNMLTISITGVGMLMCLIGQWPYQETWEKFFIQTVFVPAVFSQAVIQGGGMITAWFANDIDAFMESSSPFVISLMCICKHINYTYNRGQMKRLTIIMAEDWNIFSRYSYEYDILCKSYAMGRKVTIAYAVSLYGSMTPFLIVPVLMNTAGYMGLYNISEGRPLMFRTEHFIDSHKYYYPLLVHSYIGTLGFVTIVVAIDSMLVFHVQHECGLCEILGYRLARIIDTATLDINLSPGNREEAASYRNAKNCVIMHNHIIEYAKHLENANTTSYFFQLGFNMMGMTFTIFQAVVKLTDPKEALRFASFTVCLFSVLFLESWPGQQLSDYTDKIFPYTTDGKWYQSSLRIKKMIAIMLMRSYVPIKITAGKLYTLNLENFAAVVRTSFSYFTVLCSMQ